MATKKGKGPAPAPLDAKTTKKLLDLLSTDNAFRRLFKKDAHAALAKAGYKVPDGGTHLGGCLQLKPTDRIAPKAKVVRDREKLEKSVSSVVGFVCAKEFSAD